MSEFCVFTFYKAVKKSLPCVSSLPYVKTIGAEYLRVCCPVSVLINLSLQANPYSSKKGERARLGLQAEKKSTAGSLERGAQEL
jgi:hypothetical protein